MRLIAASNRNLADAARLGTFRSDLYYRLRVFPIELPPLRARKEDIPLLVWHFLERLTRRIGKQIERVPGATMDRLIAHDWPGNIRELRNVLERALVLSPGPVLRLDEFGESLQAAGPAPTAGAGHGRSRTWTGSTSSAPSKPVTGASRARTRRRSSSSTRTRCSRG